MALINAVILYVEYVSAVSSKFPELTFKSFGWVLDYMYNQLGVGESGACWNIFYVLIHNLVN